MFEKNFNLNISTINLLKVGTVNIIIKKMNTK